MSERHEIPVGDGQTVSAVHHEASGDRWFVCCHGFRSDKSGSYERRCRRAVEDGFDAVRFDFRGCGESDGHFAESTLRSRLADLEAVLEYFDPRSCVLFGSSFGGTVAFHAAGTFAAERVDAIITRAPVTDTAAFDGYRETIETAGRLAFDDDEWIDERFVADLDRYAFADLESTLDVPVAIFHGADDDSVPVGDSLQAADRLETDVLVHVLEGEGHLFSATAERRQLAIAFAWLDAYDVG